MPEFDPIDLSSLAFWSKPARERDCSFAELRLERPVSFHRPPEGCFLASDKGFWAVVRHADVRYVSRRPEVFCSGQGVTFEAIPVEFIEFIGSFLATDAPRHTRLRHLISGAFTPRRVAAIEARIRTKARELVRAATEDGSCDVVSAIAAPLPLAVIADIIGVPPSQREAVESAVDALTSANDSGARGEGVDASGSMISAALNLMSLGTELAAKRRAHPQDDLMTALVEAAEGGEGLTDEEIAAFVVLLSVAGNDTTRNSISHGIHAFATNPDQWRRLRQGDALLSGAVEEIVRWATPAMDFRRTATTDTELAGQPIAAGDHVAMFYTSANRDERVFADPWRFDVTRTPNEHLGFGGGGPHFCLGASLARTQLSAVFGELLERVESFEVEEPEYLVSNFIHAVRRLPCTFQTG